MHLLLGTVISNEEAVKRWKDCRILVLDEISMIGDALFEKLDYVARGIRGNSQAFSCCLVETSFSSNLSAL